MRSRKLPGRICAAILMALAAPSVSASELGPCGFDEQALTFRGAEIEQARCLLSPVGKGGRIGSPPAALGSVLESRIGRPVALSKPTLRALLVRENLADLATDLDVPVSMTAEGLPARYFVIHDTSQKYPGNQFPADDEARLNHLGFRHPDGTWVAHAFVNRQGAILLALDLQVPWRATRLEKQLGPRSRGLFLHVEHNQPRLRDPALPADNDRQAPIPGLTAAQYDRSALLYIVASLRTGRWLIPAFHAVIDSGIPGAHDDPQNFDRGAFEAALERRLVGL